MTAEELKALQTPLKAQYREHPESARVTMRATATLDPAALACTVTTFNGPVSAGLHPAAGGDGSWACSGDMLLQSLVACAGVTMRAVATALGIELRSGHIMAAGEVDFRGTLGVSRETPVGISAITLAFDLESDASPAQLQKLVELTERYCVILQTLKTPPTINLTRNR